MLNDALSKSIAADIAEGSDGGTYSTRGVRVTVQGDVLTLISTNIDPRDAATAVPEFVAKWAFVAHQHGLLFGCFMLPNGQYSLDLNIALHPERRNTALAFARLNRQHSIWDGHEGRAIPTGHSGLAGSLLSTPSDVAEAAIILRG